MKFMMNNSMLGGKSRNFFLLLMHLKNEKSFLFAGILHPKGLCNKEEKENNETSGHHSTLLYTV